MKLAPILLLGLLLPLRANELLSNPDFADGVSHWDGDGESAAVATGGSIASGAGSTTGLIVQLHSTEWTKVTQEFRPLVPRGTLTVTFELSPNFSFSSDRKDYRKVSDRIGFTAFKKFRIRKGEWMAAVAEIGDQGRSRLLYYPMPPGRGTAPQTATAQVAGMGVDEDRVLCLAFPPGTGSITLLHVSLDGH